MKPLAIDLFCGAGGVSEGVLQAGYHIIYSSDINESVEETYKNRHEQLGYVQGINTFFRRGDIREIESSQILEDLRSLEVYDSIIKDREIDVIFGGPPCQGFSRAGRRDKDDPRNLLFKEYLRVINDIRPRYVVMENVMGFMDTRLDGFIGVKGEEYGMHKLMPDILMKEFELIGYHTLQTQILDASDFGVPQRRKRAIFIAYKNGEKAPSYPAPSLQTKVTVGEAISDLSEGIDTGVSDYIRDSREGRTRDVFGNPVSAPSVLNNEKSTHSLAIVERFSIFKEGENAKDLFKRIQLEGLDLTAYPNLVNEARGKIDNEIELDFIMHNFKTGEISEDDFKLFFTKKMNRFRFNSKQIAPTVVTMPDDYISPYEDRIPTVREMARLQSFDDSFEFLGKRTTGGLRRRVEVPQYSQVGNAVPPLLARAIALELKKYL